MLSVSSLLTKALIFTVTSQTGSSVPQSIIPTPCANTGRAHLMSIHITRSDQEKLSFLPAVRRTRANVRLLDKGSELAIRVPT